MGLFYRLQVDLSIPAVLHGLLGCSCLAIVCTMGCRGISLWCLEHLLPILLHGPWCLQKLLPSNILTLLQLKLHSFFSLHFLTRLSPRRHHLPATTTAGGLSLFQQQYQLALTMLEKGKASSCVSQNPLLSPLTTKTCPCKPNAQACRGLIQEQIFILEMKMRRSANGMFITFMSVFQNAFPITAIL